MVCRERHAVLMGVLNVTPDSFYDGGRYTDAESQERRIDRLLGDGADIIDIGAESTRPGAAEITPGEQIARARTALAYAVSKGALVSIDTTSPEVAHWALGEGAHVVNDVSCLSTPELAAVVARYRAVLLLMHSRGAMKHMPGFSSYPDDAYEDVVVDVAREWDEARKRALGEGLPQGSIWFDPGLGFHKSGRHSLELLGRLREFAHLGARTCVGPGRKSFIGQLDGSSPAERLGGTIAACLAAVSAGARILRVHDVKEVRQALLVHKAIADAGGTLSDQMHVPALETTMRERLDA